MEKNDDDCISQDSVNWVVKQRLILLEATAYWSGEMVSHVLTESFGISRVQATKDISLYLSLRPNNLRYDRSLKRYQITEEFSPLYINGSADELFQILQTYQSQQAAVVTLLANLPSVASITPLTQHMDTEVLRPIIQATRFGYELKISYQSLTTDEIMVHRIQPSNLFYDGRYWHIRAYCFGTKEYLTFSLIRITHAQTAGRAKPLKIADKLWEQYVEAEIAPHSGLAEGQRKIVEKLYGMVNGKITTSVRAAMLPYFLKSIGIGTDDQKRKADEQQVILLNRKALQKYLRNYA